MFSFNFGSNDLNECENSDEENIDETIVEVPAEVTLCSYKFPNDSLKLLDNLEIKVLSRENLVASLKDDNDNSIQEAENSNSDLIPGVYEGGLKIWECTFDLAKHLLENKDSICFGGKSVLDLGCGAGILGIIAKHLGSETVDFQDYNNGVIKHLTIPNVKLNFTNTFGSKFWAGDWRAFRQKSSYDIILTSETIYNPKSYNKLHKLFKENLKPHGAIFLAAKLYYFGVGGSINEFGDFLEKKGIFSYKNVFTSEDGVKRAIIEIQFKS